MIISEYFNINSSVISNIKTGVLWCHIEINEAKDYISKEELQKLKKKQKKRTDEGKKRRIEALRQKHFEKHNLSKFGIDSLRMFEEQCKRLYMQGESIREIALYYKVSHHVVSNIIKSNGISIEKQPKKGSQHSSAKLTEEKVREIKKLIERGVKQYLIAEKFEISPSVITEIKNGKTWRHVQ